MKKIAPLILLGMVFLGCDPVAQMEANVENQTSENLTVFFISQLSDLNKTLELAPNESALFQERFDVGNTYLEVSLMEYDSVYIQNEAEEILKVFKQNSPGKNIFNVSDWNSQEPDKRVFIYTYALRNSDF